MKWEALEKYLAPLKRKVMQTVARGIVKALSDGEGIQRLQVALLADELQSDIDRIQNYGFTSVPKLGAEAVYLAVGGSREHGIVIAVDDRRFRLKNLAEGEVAMYTDEGDTIHFKRNKLIEINSGNEIYLKATTKIRAEAPNIEATATVKIKATAPTIEAVATTKADLTAPLVTITAATKIDAITPLLNVSGVVACAGIATGGATPVPGDAVLTGNLTAQGNVSDLNGSMQEMRDTYNGHTHPENGTGGGTTSAPNEPMS